MDVFEVLKNDHQRVRDMFSQLTKTETRHKKTRQDLFQELRNELIAHSHVEEKLFYPKLLDKPPTHDVVEEGINEHHQVEQLLDRIGSMPVDSDQWLNSVQDLQKMVEHHLREEEADIFPQARSLLPAEETDPLGDQVKREEEQEKQRMAH